MTSVKIINIIENCILSEIHNMNWYEVKNNIIENFNSVNLFDLIENYEPCSLYGDGELYVDIPTITTCITNTIPLLNKIFVKLGYKYYNIREGYVITGREMRELVRTCVQIMVIKQQGY